ncbi:hypothetical protein GOBAR_DD02071 [Gossypium barbadense]|nr:hypothetical protein GOBAR_DD02071 [Gossypium barbadense]
MVGILFLMLLRLRRPFIAYITDAMGNELFRVRRPFWWITSSIYVEIDGKHRTSSFKDLKCHSFLGNWCGSQTEASLEEGV